jgi:hypothetical protein
MRIHPVAVSLLFALPLTAAAQDADRSVAGGGIGVAGWKGKIDARAASQGKTVNDSKFAMKGDKMELKIGPAAIYWNDANKASGNYEVKTSFTENGHKSGHPHSYGVFIGGTDLDNTDSQSFTYCIVYANGTYSVKNFHGQKVTTVVDRAASPAINKATDGGSATNEVGWRVKGGKASCVINGKEAQTWDAAQLVGADKLKSTDGVYGVRVSHNLDLTMTPLKLSKL